MSYYNKNFGNPKKELESTVNHLKTVVDTDVKFVLLRDESKKTNFNKDLNTVFVNKRDINRYTLLKDFVK